MSILDRTKVMTFAGPLPEDLVQLKRARIEDRISTLSRAYVEFVSEDNNLDLSEMVGSPHVLTIPLEGGDDRYYHGLCTEAQYLRVEKGVAHYSCVLHPTIWVLTRNRDCRIFQEMTAMDIVKQVLQDRGLTDFEDRTTASFRTREYTVQYNETDFDFISRLMEEEGVFYFFEHAADKATLIFGDAVGAHRPVPGATTIPFREPDDATPLDFEHFSTFRGQEAITSGKVTLDDYNFKTPGADLAAVREIQKGSHSYKNRELYDYPRGYTTADEGTHYARVRMERAAQQAATWRAGGVVSNVGVGQLFTLEKHPRSAWNKEYMVAAATIVIEEEPGYEHSPTPVFGIRTDVEVVDKVEPYRPLAVTPRPDISGVHLALVVGKSGEEIWTDEYGRVKLQFYWDRDGQLDENATCWVRVATPFSGKNWGMIHIPRIGQEVVVQFEGGNPDLPVVTGMMWNADNKPPYTLPANATMQGIKTNKSKGGGGFNELVFEDKKEAEYVRLQSERDYKEIIKNNAEISIGEVHQDKGDLTETIYRHKTQTLKTGDHTFKIEQGNQVVEIKKDRTETIEGKRTQTVTQDVTETYKAKLTQTVTSDVTETYKAKMTQTVTGNVTETVKQGNVTRTVKMGNVTDTIKMGNLKVKTALGKVTIEAMQAIELKVGSSKIKIDMSGVTIQGLMVKVQGTAMTQVKGPMVQVDGSAMVMVKGGMVMVN